MRKFTLTLLLCLLSTLSTFAATPVTVTGNIRSILGTAAGNGAFLRIRLRNFSGWVPTVPGVGLAPTAINVTPDASGNISTTLWGNDIISPGPNLTYYTFEFHATGAQNSQFVSEDFFVPISLVTYPASPSTIFNFLTATPLAIPPPSPQNAVLQNPIGGQNILQPNGTFLQLNSHPIVSMSGASTAGSCLVDQGNFVVADSNLMCGSTISAVLLSPIANQTITGGFSLTLSGALSVSGLLTSGSASQASPLGTVVPSQIETLSAPSLAYINNPDVYISRLDTTPGSSSCPTSGCGAPVLRIDATNSNTGSQPALIGEYINMENFQSTTLGPTQGGSAIAYSSIVADKAAANNVDMRGMNNTITVQDVPVNVDSNGFTRSAFGYELDILNLSGVDAVFGATGVAGNYIGGNTVVGSGANNLTLGFAVSFGGTTGKGFYEGYDAAGFVDTGYAAWDVNTTSATTGFGCYSGGSQCFAADAFTVPSSTRRLSGYTTAVPAIGYLAGPSANIANSGSINSVWRAFAGDTSHTNEWRLYQNNTLNSMRFEYGSNCAAAAPCSSYNLEWLLDSNGNTIQTGNLQFAYSGTASYQFAYPAPTGSWTIQLPQGNSDTVMVAALTTTSATTDNVSITGMLSTGHCSLTATNSSAATNIATTYISAKTTNQITVTHTGTSGMTYDILCTPL